jgi:hypothetical protein
MRPAKAMPVPVMVPFDLRTSPLAGCPRIIETRGMHKRDETKLITDIVEVLNAWLSCWFN